MSVRYFCHFNDGEVVIEANYHEIWVSAWHPKPPEDYFHSVIIHCPVPNRVSFQKEAIFISQDIACDKHQGIFLPVKNTKVEIKGLGGFPLFLKNEMSSVLACKKCIASIRKYP